jgi:exopolyphosphatase/guanosine-5'-triphosphate,3'-diphosphate pyrophosphatase
MTTGRPLRVDRIVAFLDIGTNSVRLLVVRLNANHSFTILSRQKQQVRLGDGEFESDTIQPEAIDRLALVCRRFTDLAHSFHTEEFVAVATSAMREATNRYEILHLLRQVSGLDVRIVSGEEEARLIYLGIASGVNLEGRPAVFIDIGGGSTEIAIGDEKGHRYLESLRLGAIRLANRYLSTDPSGPVPPEVYRRMHRHVKDVSLRMLETAGTFPIESAIGSSGTIINLAEIARRMYYPQETVPRSDLRFKDLRKIIKHLCSLPLDARKKVPGINPDRADIIIAGAAILETVMKILKIDSIAVTNRGLQDGLLVDYLSRMDSFPLQGELTPRERSVRLLGRSCGLNEVHARTVTLLALELFDSAGVQGLHPYGSGERELLEYASFLHDIGSFISYTNHHAHSHYLISNSELLGFDPKEITLMANTARFHRKKTPSKRDLEEIALNADERDTLKMLTSLLRLAESLDRSHIALIRHVRFSAGDNDTVRLEILARGDCHLEIWALENEKRAFEKVFGKRLVFEVLDEREPVPEIADYRDEESSKG